METLQDMLAALPDHTLLWILEFKLPGWKDPNVRRPVVIAGARKELVRRYPCIDCGAEKGSECKPDYGCEDKSRTPQIPESSPRFVRGPVGGVHDSEPQKLVSRLTRLYDQQRELEHHEAYPVVSKIPGYQALTDKIDHLERQLDGDSYPA